MPLFGDRLAVLFDAHLALCHRAFFQAFDQRVPVVFAIQVLDQNQVDLGEGKVTGLFVREQEIAIGKSGGIQVDPETLVFGPGDQPRDIDNPAAFGGAGSVTWLVRGFRLSPF